MQVLAWNVTKYQTIKAHVCQLSFRWHMHDSVACRPTCTETSNKHSEHDSKCIGPQRSVYSVKLAGWSILNSVESSIASRVGKSSPLTSVTFLGSSCLCQWYRTIVTSVTCLGGCCYKMTTGDQIQAEWQALFIFFRLHVVVRYIWWVNPWLSVDLS